MKKLIIFTLILLSCDNESTKKSALELGEDLFALGSYSEALEKFEQYKSENPDKKTEQTNIGINWSKLKLVETNNAYLNEAKVGFDQIISLNPSNEDALYGRALIFLAIRSNFATVKTNIHTILFDDSFRLSLDKSIDESHVYLLLSQIEYYENNYSESLTAIASVYQLLGVTFTLTDQDPDFVFKLAQSIEDALDIINN